MDLMEEVRTYENSRLPDYQKAALRFTDALIADPTGFDMGAQMRLKQYFSAEQIVELTFKLMYWSCNKAGLPIGLMQSPINSDRPTSFRYDETTGALHLDVDESLVVLTSRAPENRD
jgi:hypothetical protein